jgi:glycosyl transferase family 4
MRILVVSPVLPHLPSHDAARLGPSQLIDQLSERHAVGVVAATAGPDTPAARAWLAARVAWLETPPARRWRSPASGRPARGLLTLADAVQRARREFRPDVVHLEGSVLAPLARVAGAPTVLACHESAALRAREAARRAGRPWRRGSRRAGSARGSPP